MKYRREIDGLRALAVLPVILFHAGFALFGGGYVGVDIFFVISGYLITTIITAELQGGRFSIVNFYERRARRILPALFLVMLCTLPFAWLWMPPQDLQSFSKSLVAVPLFSSNILFYLTSGYFDTSSEIKPLLHTWSLAVEEQYYVLFPLFLWLAWRLGRRWIVALLAAAAVASVLAAQHFVKTHPSFTFYMLPTRGFEILIGALISFYVSRRPDVSIKNPLVSEILSIAGFSMISYSILAFDKSTPAPSIFTLMPTIGSALIIVYSSQRNIVGRILGCKVLVGLGLISYSAYLWHQPLLAFARLRLDFKLSLSESAILCVGALVFGFLTWKFVELPFRDRRNFDLKAVCVAALVFTAAFVLTGFAGWVGKGFPQRFPGAPYEFSEDSPLTNIARIDNGWCFYSIDSIKRLKSGRDGVSCSIGSHLKPRYKGIIFGDSFAGSYEPFWDYIGRTNNFEITSDTTNWCYPSFTTDVIAPQSSRAYQQCLFDRQYLKDNDRRFDFVILGGMWSEVLKRGKLSEVTALIDTLSKKTKLVIVMPSPKQYDYSPMADYQRQFMFKRKFEISKIGAKDDVFAQRANETLRAASQNYPNVIFLGRDSVFAGKEVSDTGIPYSADGVHVSIYGSLELAKQFSKRPEYTALIRKMGK